jgi:hypothetical protein
VNALLGLSRFIDAMSERVGKSAMWLLLFAVLISTVNAIVRKAFNYSSNGFLEIQWYLFAGAFLPTWRRSCSLDGAVPAVGLSGGLRAGRLRHLLRLIGIELGLLSPVAVAGLPERIFGIMSNDTLLAIPFFTFMGLILERSGMAEDLLDTIGQLFGPIRGGLAYAVIFVGALLAATTGVVAASVISMGLISLPIMLRYGYDRRSPPASSPPRARWRRSSRPRWC